jgi:hypothetical protein
LAVLAGGPPLWGSWGQLLHSVRTGAPAFDHVHGVDLFEYNRRHPEAGTDFDQAMASNTALAVRAVAAAYDFSAVGTVVDVGGGTGALAPSCHSRQIARARKRLRARMASRRVLPSATRRAR